MTETLLDIFLKLYFFNCHSCETQEETLISSLQFLKNYSTYLNINEVCFLIIHFWSFQQKKIVKSMTVAKILMITFQGLKNINFLKFYMFLVLYGSNRKYIFIFKSFLTMYNIYNFARESMQIKKLCLLCCLILFSHRNVVQCVQMKLLRL